MPPPCNNEERHLGGLDSAGKADLASKSGPAPWDSALQAKGGEAWGGEREVVETLA